MMIVGFVAALLVALILLIIIFVAAIIVSRKSKKAQQQNGFNHAALTASMMKQSDINTLLAFLNEADNAYIRSYQYRSLGELIQFTTRELAMEMQQKITYYNDKIWGTPKQRQRTWSVVSTDGTSIIVRKELTFKKVKYGRMLVKLGDDTVEYWKVKYDNLNNTYKIQEITC